nr:MAG TPA: PROTEIN (FOUR-HELIX BUNDLE MODEL)-HELICAL BUNDLE, PROTEIN DESIGN, DE [Caudoviricetes sp.]
MSSVQEVVNFILDELDNYGYDIGDKYKNTYYYDNINNTIELIVNGTLYNIEYIPDANLSTYNNAISYIASNLNVKNEDLDKLLGESIENSKKKLTEDFNSKLNSSDKEAGEILPLDESYPALLVALDSERDAEVTYKTLIEIEKSSNKPNQRVIDLLEKILKEELQHIALLSALQAENNSEFVGEDSQEDFDSYINDIKDDDNDSTKEEEEEKN